MYNKINIELLHKDNPEVACYFAWKEKFSNTLYLVNQIINNSEGIKLSRNKKTRTKQFINLFESTGATMNSIKTQRKYNRPIHITPTPENGLIEVVKFDVTPFSRERMGGGAEIDIDANLVFLYLSLWEGIGFKTLDEDKVLELEFNPYDSITFGEFDILFKAFEKANYNYTHLKYKDLYFNFEI